MSGSSATGGAGSLNGWRLPTVEEFKTILDSRKNSCLPGMAESLYWTWTSNYRNINEARLMRGASGGHYFDNKVAPYRVRYVRGTITLNNQGLIRAATRFQPIQNGGYIDQVTGLQWKAVDDGDKTWYDAMGRQAPKYPYKTRGFELVTGYSHKLPERSTEFSAGYDFFSPEDVLIFPNDTYFLQTGVKAYMKPGEVLKIYIRSSFGRDGLELKNKVPVIDCDFYDNPGNEGNITLMLKNAGTDTFRIKKGDKVVQGIFLTHALIDGDSFEQPRNARSGGIGSTGK